MSRGNKKVPKQVFKLLVRTPVTINRYLPDEILEDFAQVTINWKYIHTKEIYVVYHSNSLNRLIWVSIPTGLIHGYESRCNDMRLIDYMNFDIPNKEDRLTLILIIRRKYDFTDISRTSVADIYMPKKKKTFRSIANSYYAAEEKKRGAI